MFNFNSNTIFGLFAGSSRSYQALYTGPTSQNIFRDFIGDPILNSGDSLYRKGPEFKFERPGPATFYNSLCTLSYAFNNIPRFEYSPNGTFQGLLIEGTTANELKYSSDFTNTDTWTVLTSTDGFGVTLTPTTAVSAPDGTLTATLLSGNPAIGFRAICTNNNIISEEIPYTRTIFIKQNEGRYAFFCAGNPISLGLPQEDLDLQSYRVATRIFDFENKQFVQFPEGGVMDTPYNDRIYVEVLPHGWFRIGTTRTPSNESTKDLCIGTAATSAWESALYTNPNDIGSFYIWGAQHEIGDFYSSYIPTSGDRVIRPGDRATMTRLSGYYNPKESSFYIKGKRNSIFMPGTFGSFVQDTDQYWELASNDITIDESDPNKRQQRAQGLFYTYEASTSSINLTALKLVPNISYTLIGAVSTDFNLSNLYYAQDSTFVDQITGTTLSPTSPYSTSFRLGRRGNNSQYLNGHIQQLGYWPSYITFNTLSALI